MRQINWKVDADRYKHQAVSVTIIINIYIDFFYKLQQLEDPEHNEMKNLGKGPFDRLKNSDYSWLPPWGLLTKKTIDIIYDSKKTKFVMKDNSVVHLCKLENFPEMLHNESFSWVVDNPGRDFQLVFHFSHPETPLKD